MKAFSVDKIAYWVMNLSVLCPQKIVVQGNVANFSPVKNSNLFIKRCSLRIIVCGQKKNQRSIENYTLISMAIRW